MIMNENTKDATYNEGNERQRMLNQLAKNGLRGDDVHGRLAWNIVTQTHELAYKQDELFAEMCNLINKIRNSKR
jgi:hypothetical protein